MKRTLAITMTLLILVGLPGAVFAQPVQESKAARSNILEPVLELLASWTSFVIEALEVDPSEGPEETNTFPPLEPEACPEEIGCSEDEAFPGIVPGG